MQSVKIMAPPTNCLSPIGEEAIRAGLQKRMPGRLLRPPSPGRPRSTAATPSRSRWAWPTAASCPADELIEVYRARQPRAAAVPALGLRHHQGGPDDRLGSYGLQQSKGALPTGPLVLMVHIASVWVPFTSESKEAIAHYPEIIKELRLAHHGSGPAPGQSTSATGARAADEAKKRSYIDKFIPHIGVALREILALSDKQEGLVVSTLRETLERSREHNA